MADRDQALRDIADAEAILAACTESDDPEIQFVCRCWGYLRDKAYRKLGVQEGPLREM